MPYLLSLCLLALALFPLTGSTEEEKTLYLPPASLAQWYKPTNKRQVWLHTMFRLRRSMQAVNEYVELKNDKGLEKWGHKLIEDYRKIPEMVPEWADEVEFKWADQLEQALQKKNYKGIKRATKKLSNTCNSCHREYRSLVAALYRTPDYSKIHLNWAKGKEASLPEAMADLSQLLNRVKIADEDGQPKRALKALKQLSKGLEKLGTTCAQCHKDPAPRERILGTETKQTLKKLKTAIEKREAKKTRKLLGSAAVMACARCHGVHRTLGNLKAFLQPLDL